MKITLDNIDQLAWSKMNDLIPCVVQDTVSGKILMQGYMNPKSVEVTFETGNVTFWSRSKNALWTKGESSGHFLKLVELAADCDQDCIVAMANPIGPTCHTGTETCWHNGTAQPDMAFITDLERLIESRKGADASSSYTASLFSKGIKRIAQKVGEEGVETALAATVQDIEELKNESADLIYHLLVLLQASDVTLSDVINVLKERHSK